MCQWPRKQKTCVLFTGTVKLPNSAVTISNVTKPISYKFMHFLPYIYNTSHIKIKGNHFSISWDICSWKLKIAIIKFYWLKFWPWSQLGIQHLLKNHPRDIDRLFLFLSKIMCNIMVDARNIYKITIYDINTVRNLNL